MVTRFACNWLLVHCTIVLYDICVSLWQLSLSLFVVDWQVRDHPLYHLIKARILKKSGDSTEAVKTLQMAMVLPGVKTSGKLTMNIQIISWYLNWHTYHFLICLMYSTCIVANLLWNFEEIVPWFAQGRDPCQRKGRFWTSVQMTECLCSWSWQRPTRHWEKRSVTVYNSRTITSM